MVSSDALLWVLAVEAVMGGVGLVVLGVCLWKARLLVDQLVKLTAGAGWTADRSAEAFAQAARSIDLAAQAAWSAPATNRGGVREVGSAGLLDARS